MNFWSIKKKKSYFEKAENASSGRQGLSCEHVWFGSALSETNIFLDDAKNNKKKNISKKGVFRKKMKENNRAFLTRYAASEHLLIQFKQLPVLERFYIYCPIEFRFQRFKIKSM